MSNTTLTEVAAKPCVLLQAQGLGLKTGGITHGRTSTSTGGIT